MDDLIVFLRARLDEDEQVARAARTGTLESWVCKVAWPGDLVVMAGVSDYEVVNLGSKEWPQARELANFITHYDPARVLREAEAKRRIIDEHHPRDPCDAHDASFETIPCDTLLLLALPYADHPDYREEWKP